MTLLDATHPAVPVAVLGDYLPSGRINSAAAREVIVTVARAALGAKVYLESQPPGGPRERVRAFALPYTPGSTERAYRAVLAPLPAGTDGIYIPLAVLDGQETRGEALRLTSPSSADESASKIASSPSRLQDFASVSRQSTATNALSVGQQRGGTDAPLPFPAMEHLARVQARLPDPTIFGATPEGVQLAFYITDGRWSGPRVRARYRSEAGDWMLVRRDGVGIPNARATLETDDGSLHYYRLTGTVDLGPDGYARTLANDFPDIAPLTVVATIATSSERWSWLNRLTIVGAGVVLLKTGEVLYDVYSIGCDPSVLRDYKHA